MTVAKDQGLNEQQDLETMNDRLQGTPAPE